MTQQEAEALARKVAGYAEDTGGGIWVAIVDAAILLVFSDEGVGAYSDRGSIEAGEPFAFAPINGTWDTAENTR